MAHDLEFIAVDGEADTTVSGDPYVLLSVGDRSLHENGRRLTHHDIFPFLWDCYKENPQAAFVGFFLGYDFAQWLRSISVHEARMLLTAEGIAKRARTKSGGNPMPFPVYIGDEWEIDLLGNKRFKLRPQGSKEGWMYICDAGSFFQTSLLNAIKPSEWGDEPLCTPTEYETVLAGKSTRDDAAFNAEMIKYNVLENRILSTMMDRLNTGFTAIDVRLDKHKWFGPGQAAQAWMGPRGVPTTTEVGESVPTEVLKMAQASFYGGWFEVFRHGNLAGETYEYDINSAYPHTMRSLPCLLHGQWTAFGKVRNAKSFHGPTLVRASVYGSNPYIGTMLHRESKQTILRPHCTSGVFWHHELEAARRAGLVDRVAIESGYTYEPCDCPPPLRGVADLYQQRLQVGKRTVHGKACKLVYNSMYGKTAQSTGVPKFANPVYASLITSGCRTMILDAIATHPKGAADLAMVATDGIYFRSPHPGLELSNDELGKWDSAVLSNLTILKPGVYWHDKTREAVRRNEGFKLKSRGISARDLAGRMHEFDILFRDWGPERVWPSLYVNVQFSVQTAKVAITRGKWEDCGRSIRDSPIIVNSDPSGKRDTGRVRREGGDWRTDPYPVPPSGHLESVPYSKSFGMADAWATDELTPDGDVATVVNSLMGR